MDLQEVRFRLRRAIDGKGFEEYRIRPSVVVLFLPLLLVLLVAAGCVLAIIAWVLLALEHALELFDPTPTRTADEEAQLQQQHKRERDSSSVSLSRRGSSSRLTRVGSFVCGWLWVEGQPVWAPAPAQSWDYLLLHRQLRRLVGAAYSGLRSRLLSGAPREPTEKGVISCTRRGKGFFVLARDELRWYTDEASSGRPPLGAIRLDAIVEVKVADAPPPTREAEPPVWGYPFVVLFLANPPKNAGKLGRRWSPLSVLASELGSERDSPQQTPGAPPAVRELRLAATSEAERDGWMLMLHKAAGSGVWDDAKASKAALDVPSV